MRPSRMRRFVWASTVVAMVVWASIPVAAWAFDVYAFITVNGAQLPGEPNADPNKDGGIAIKSFTSGINQPYDQGTGFASGKRQHKPLTITKQMDKSSPLLAQAIAQTQGVDTAIFKFFRPNPTGGGSEHYYSIKLENGLVVDYLQAGGVTTETESVSFVYQKITWTYVPDGTTATDDWTGQ